MKDFRVEFLLDGARVGTSIVQAGEGKVVTSHLEEDFQKLVRRLESYLLKQVEDEERHDTLVGLSAADEEKLKAAFGADYRGVTEDFQNDYECWLEDLSLDELKQLLK